MTDKVTDELITVMLLGSGYAAVHLVKVVDEHGEYWDIQQTGIGRYKTCDEAKIEAVDWSKSDEIRLDTSV